MGYLQRGTVPKNGKIPYIAIFPHLLPLKRAPTHCLVTNSLSSAVLPTTPLQVYSVNFRHLCSASGEFFNCLYHQLPPDGHSTCGGPNLIKRHPIWAHLVACSGDFVAPHIWRNPKRGAMLSAILPRIYGISRGFPWWTTCSSPWRTDNFRQRLLSEDLKPGGGARWTTLAGEGEAFPLLPFGGTLPSLTLLSFFCLWAV